MFGAFQGRCGCAPGQPCAHGEGSRAGRARWGGFDEIFAEFGFGSGARRGRGGPGGQRGRMFEQGDLKLVILRLLEEKPRHGYDIIKEIEERFGGTYAPSPGTVYPTLTMLEDMGYAKGTVEEGGKKIYAITEEGRKHLADNSQAVDSIFERMARFVEGFFDAPMNDVHEGMRRVARAAYSTATRNVRDAQKLRQVREILDRATREIEDLARASGSTGTAGSGSAGEGTGTPGTSQP